MMEIITNLHAILIFLANYKPGRIVGCAHLMCYGILNSYRCNIITYYNSSMAFIVTALIVGITYENSSSTNIINVLIFEAIITLIFSKLIQDNSDEDNPAAKHIITYLGLFDYMFHISGRFFILIEILEVILNHTHTMHHFIAFILRRWLRGIIVTSLSRSVINDTIKPMFLRSILECSQPSQTCTNNQMWSAVYRCILTDMVLGIIIIASDVNHCESTTSMNGAVWLAIFTVIRLVVLLSKSYNILSKYNLVSLAEINENNYAKQMTLHCASTNNLTSTSASTELIKNSPTHSLQANGNDGINDIQIQIETSEEQYWRSNVTAQQTYCYATQQFYINSVVFPQYWHRHASSSLPQKYGRTWWQNSTTSAQYPDALQQYPDVLQNYPRALQQNLYKPLQRNYCFTQLDTLLATGNKTKSNAANKQLTYSMKQSPRGIGVIINNEKFNALQPRFGAAMDIHNLENLFQYLNFDTQSHKNKTHTEMRQILNDVAGMDHDKYDCLMVAILTHGDYGDVLYGTSGGITIQEVIETFSGKRCPTLIGKPKMFIIQACRGKRLNLTVELNDTIDDECDMVDSGPTVHPSISDYLVAYSTIPGHVSYRNNNNGSIYISTLVKIFRRFSADEDLITILERVTDEVIRYEPQGYRLRNSRQIPEVHSTLRGKVYFNTAGKCKYD